jgi:F-type H+-transporting ATPase subunit gamma
MASGQERVLRRRIRSVEATKKLTRAMELISASQIVRAQSRIRANRPYIDGLAEAVRITIEDATGPTRLVGVPEDPHRVLFLAVVSDRGLAGAYNSNVLRTTERRVAEGEKKGHEFELVTVGRKAQGYFRFRNRPVEQSFIKMSERPSFDDARQVAAAAIRPFLLEEVDLVEIVSTRFISSGRQLVEVRQLLPAVPPEPVDEERHDAADANAPAGGFYDFEPSSDDLLAKIVPQFAEAQVFAAMLEAAASEHAARQRAMAAATDNAGELIKKYSRIMNRARQDTITTEIMEIVGGAEALRAADSAHGGLDLLTRTDHEEPYE